MKLKNEYVILPILIIFIGCRAPDENTHLFELKRNNRIGIDFINQLDYTEELNTYTYRNFYNGGGVGIGDINNDSLLDIYFTGNLVDNHLYLNKGNWRFEEISKNAGVACENIWSTGISMVDINGDGWLDMYVCKSGPPGGPNRHNELFINNKNLTFTERAEEYGLADEGLSTHAAFFDYDRDGDLDCYLLNNSLRSVSGFDFIKDQREIRDTLGGNKLYRNENGHFVDVSADAGIYGSKIGFGLGVTIGDVNGDHWPDIYVSNDYFEKDYLYINNGNGTFSESIERYTNEISLSSMGADMADLNNDGYPEIFVTDMLPSAERRIKTKTTFDNWDKYHLQEERGYFKQFTRNALQLNNGDGTFSEVSRFSGVSATDWSWGALIFDLDNDGLKDIFVANGIYKDLTDQDYVNFIADPNNVRKILKEEHKVIVRLVDSIPSEPLPNVVFMNDGNMRFSDEAHSLGLGKPSFSNGAAFGDLDNDGDLDLVVNNVNMSPFIYENKLNNTAHENHYLRLKLRGKGHNTFALGAEVTVYVGKNKWYQENMTMRSYQSTTENRMHFGLGEVDVLDSVKIVWPNGELSTSYDMKTDQEVFVDQNKIGTVKLNKINREKNAKQVFTDVTERLKVDFFHKENDFVDFDRDRLLISMSSNEGPCLCAGDINEDGIQDVYVGGAKGENGKWFLSDKTKFQSRFLMLKDQNSTSEDVDCAIFDANNDGHLDFYIASGGNEFPSSSQALSDRLYINQGKGKFLKSNQNLPGDKYESSATVEVGDFDNDGDEDLFVGIRLKPFQYGIPVQGYLLRNDGHGQFENITSEHAPGLEDIGLITDAVWADIDGDNDLDLVVVGQWMPIKIFLNEDGIFTDASERFLRVNTTGLWRTIEAGDLDNDGDVDFVLGNLGLNSKIKATESKPASFYINDFDANGTVDHFICTYNGEKSYPLVLRQDLVVQIPSLKSKYLKFSSYGEQTMADIFSNEQLKRSIKYEATMMESIVLRNHGNINFKVEILPDQAQFSSIYAVAIADFDKDGIVDIVLGGNQHRAKPEIGINDATYGVFLKGKSKTFEWRNSLSSGLFVEGQIRKMSIVPFGDESLLFIARNNDKVLVYAY